MLLLSEEVEGRQHRQVTHARSSHCLGLGNRPAGAGFAQSAHHRYLAAGLFQHRFDGQHLLVVGQKGKPAHRTICEQRVHAGVDQVTGDAAQAGYIDPVVVGKSRANRHNNA